jgi:hypothetical protein
VCKRLPFGANPLWVEPPVGSLPITRPLSNLDPLCTQMGYNIPLAKKEKMRETHLFHGPRAEEKKTRKTVGTKKTRKAPNMYQNKST